MIFEFKNLGSIKEAQIEMGNLTVICGKNNTGKTYLTYVVWGMLSNQLTYTMQNPNTFPEIDKIDIKNRLNSGKVVEVDLELVKKSIERKLFNDIEGLSAQLHKIFSINKSFFQNTIININATDIDLYAKELKRRYSTINTSILYEKDVNSHIVKLFLEHKNQAIDELDVENLWLFLVANLLYSPVFLLTAQRDSVELFYKTLDKQNSNLINKLRETKNLDLLEQIARFALPIEKNIDFARDLLNITKYNSFLTEENSTLLSEIELILGVNFIISNETVLIKDTKTSTIIPSYVASTSVRSLLHLHFWLKHQARKGDLLMIDEPELNLHPENQIKMARLFAKLVNAGIRVWITTHSDYIVKELNNCIMLGNVSNRTEILEKYKGEYSENDILKAEDLKAYIAYNLPDGGSTVRKIEIDKYGMVESTFDETIDKMNEISQTFADNID